MNWSARILDYIEKLHYNGNLPKKIRIMNPYRESEQALAASRRFYEAYYSDALPRQLIMGINPGRHGAGATGIPFTDPKKLVEVLGIPWEGTFSHEPSSVFVYDMIAAFGGPESFYSRYFINSVSPLGYTILNESGKEINYNYYDSETLFRKLKPFIRSNLENLQAMGFNMDICFVLGVKNMQYLQAINEEGKFFGKLVPLEHPRYIMQYRLRQKQAYIEKYLKAFSAV